MTSPLLREAEVVPAPGLPVPFGLDAESRRQRALRAAQRTDGHGHGPDPAADHERRFADWRDELVRRNPRPAQPDRQAPCAQAGGGHSGADGQCAAGSAGATVSGGPGPVSASSSGAPVLGGCGSVGSCPVHLFSDWLFLRDALLRRELLTCLAAGADEFCGDGGAAALLAARADAVVTNQLHAALCPDQPDCAATDEISEQSRALGPERRLRLAIEEDRRLQRGVPGRPPPGCCEEDKGDGLGHGDGHGGDGGHGHGGDGGDGGHGDGGGHGHGDGHGHGGDHGDGDGHGHCDGGGHWHVDDDPEVHVRMPVHAGERLPGPAFQDDDDAQFDAQTLGRRAEQSAGHGRRHKQI